MARKKDLNWNLPEENTWPSIHAALLMDIRDELKQMNRYLNALDPRATAQTVVRIDRRLQQHAPLPKGRFKK